MLAPNSNTAPITYIVIPFLYSAFSLGDAETYFPELVKSFPKLRDVFYSVYLFNL